MEDSHIAFLAAQIRGRSHQKTTFTLSTNTLSYLLSAFESTTQEQSTSFHLKQPNLKAEFLRDLQFLQEYFEQTKTLKLHGEGSEDIVDISKFRNVLSLEFYKVDVRTVKGLQGLRPLLQKLVCQKTGNTLKEVLSDCGGDETHAYCWSELKEAVFVGGGIEELDQSLECAPWLHTLDLSHNEIKDLESLSCLHNLKSLNLAFNRLEVVAPLRGQICTRLQNLNLKNNFIEDISGLRTLTNLCVLDLDNNCLLDHKSLQTISHLATLQFLNLSNNPLSFHPHHRTKTASYLHSNTSSTQFLLDNLPLSKTEKKSVGSYYPLQKKVPNNSVMTESMSSNQEKTKKVRQVVIQDEESEGVEDDPQVRSVTPRPHLQTKRQIEDLHEKFGESWLNSQSGLLDLLGFEQSSLVMSTSPYEADFTIYSGDLPPLQPAEEVKEDEEEDINEEYNNAIESAEESFDEPDLEEESIFLARVKDEEEVIFLVLTQTHLSERECSTSEEREKWHLESILACQIMEDKISVQVDFDTMRKDRKQRLYVFEEEIEKFVDCVKRKMGARQKKKKVEEKLQCMKCNILFAKKKKGVFEDEDVVCPNCDSTLVVEHV